MYMFDYSKHTDLASYKQHIFPLFHQSQRLSWKIADKVSSFYRIVHSLELKKIFYRLKSVIKRVWRLLLHHINKKQATIPPCFIRPSICKNRNGRLPKRSGATSSRLHLAIKNGIFSIKNNKMKNEKHQHWTKRHKYTALASA